MSNIRLTDAICHVVRCFDDPNITHVENTIDPVRDIEIINLELILADLQTVENRISKVERKSKSTADKEAKAEMALLSKLKPHLEAGEPARSLQLSEEEALLVKNYNLLSSKPVIYCTPVLRQQLHQIPAVHAPQKNNHQSKNDQHGKYGKKYRPPVPKIYQTVSFCQIHDLSHLCPPIRFFGINALRFLFVGI